MPENIPKEISFVMESKALFDRLDFLYKKLRKADINPYKKIKTFDEIREAFAKINKKGLEKGSVELSKLMAKIRIQRTCYSYIYSILLMHLPRLVEAFRSAIGKREEYKIYIDMRRYRDFIEKIKFEQFHRIQREPDKKDVCKDSGFANDAMTRWKDERLANRLRTKPTGWGIEGKKRVLRLFDQRLREIERLNAPITRYYERGQQLIGDIKENLARFEKLKAVLNRQIYFYSTMTKDNALLAFDWIYDLFGVEAKLEDEGVNLVAKRRVILRDVLAQSTLLQREWVKSSSRIFLIKHGETVFLILDTIALGSLIAGCPVISCFATGVRRLGFFGRLLRYLKPVSKFLRVARKAVYEAVKLTNDIRDLRAVEKGWWERIKDVFGIGEEPAPEAVPKPA